MSLYILLLKSSMSIPIPLRIRTHHHRTCGRRSLQRAAVKPSAFLRRAPRWTRHSRANFRDPSTETLDLVGSVLEEICSPTTGQADVGSRWGTLGCLHSFRCHLVMEKTFSSSCEHWTIFKGSVKTRKLINRSKCLTGFVNRRACKSRRWRQTT